MTLLFLNSLGTGEVVLIMFVVLILFGSKGIPDVVKNLGRGMNEIKNASNEIKRDIQKSALEMRKDLNLDNPLNEISKDIDKLIEPEKTISLTPDKLSSDQKESDSTNLEDGSMGDSKAEQKDKSA
jgi:sec-independent protein translocase protein TatA